MIAGTLTQSSSMQAIGETLSAFIANHGPEDLDGFVLILSERLIERGRADAAEMIRDWRAGWAPPIVMRQPVPSSGRAKDRARRGRGDHTWRGLRKIGREWRLALRADDVSRCSAGRSAAGHEGKAGITVFLRHPPWRRRPFCLHHLVPRPSLCRPSPEPRLHPGRLHVSSCPLWPAQRASSCRPGPAPS